MLISGKLHKGNVCWLPQELCSFVDGHHGEVGAGLATLALPKARDAQLIRIHENHLAGQGKAVDEFCKTIEGELGKLVVETLLKPRVDDINLMRQLDELTPHYLYRLNNLSPQQKRIVVVFATSHSEQFIKSIPDISKYSRVSIQSAGIVLSQLIKLGFLTRTKTGSEVSYKVKDPVFHAWLVMRYGRIGARMRISFDLLGKQLKSS